MTKGSRVLILLGAGLFSSLLNPFSCASLIPVNRRIFKFSLKYPQMEINLSLPALPVASAINVLQACIYKSVKTCLFLKSHVATSNANFNIFMFFSLFITKIFRCGTLSHLIYNTWG